MEIQSTVVKDLQVLVGKEFTPSSIFHDEPVMLAFFGLNIILVNLNASMNTSKESSETTKPPSLEIRERDPWKVEDSFADASLPLSPCKIDTEGFGYYRGRSPMFEEMDNLPFALQNVPVDKACTLVAHYGLRFRPICTGIRNGIRNQIGIPP